MSSLRLFVEAADRHEDPKAAFAEYEAATKKAGCYFTMDDANKFMAKNGLMKHGNEYHEYSMINATTIVANAMSDPESFSSVKNYSEAAAKNIIKEYDSMSDTVRPYQPSDASKRPIDEESLMTIITSAMKCKSYEEFHADMKAKGTEYSQEDLVKFSDQNLDVRVSSGYGVGAVATGHASIVSANKDWYDAIMSNTDRVKTYESIASAYREAHDPDGKHLDKQTGEYDYDGLISEVAVNKTESDYAELKKLRQAYEPESSFDDVDFDDTNVDFDRDLTDD